jgi:hypothetical protein
VIAIWAGAVAADILLIGSIALVGGGMGWATFVILIVGLAAIQGVIGAMPFLEKPSAQGKSPENVAPRAQTRGV